MSSSATAAPAQAAPQPFRPPNMALTTVGLALASFMQVLNTTIANVSLPTIAGNLGASANQAVWVITSFAVSNAIALPLTGYMVRRFGELRLFVWATLVGASRLLLGVHYLSDLVAGALLGGGCALWALGGS